MKKRKQVDLPLLQQRAQSLQRLLEKFSITEPLAASCLKGLQPMFLTIMSGNVTAPYKDVPYGHYFHFDKLREYRELEEAYSSFATTATGIDDNDVRTLMASIREQNLSQSKGSD